MLNVVAPAIKGTVYSTSLHSHMLRNLHTHELMYASTLTGKNYVP